MRFLTCSRLGRGRYVQVVAGTCLSFIVVAPLGLASAQEVRTPAAQRPSRLFDRTGAVYEYGYDPYDGRMDSRAFAARGYSTYAESFFSAPRLASQSLTRTPQPPAEVFGYVEPEATAAGPSPYEQGTIFGYFYDPETGDLEYGWHDAQTSAARQPPREEIRPPTPVDWRALDRDRLRQPAPRFEETGRTGRDLEQFRGQVVEVTSYTDRTSNRVHLIARIRQPDDTLRAVEMGPFATTSVSKGDWVEGFGPRDVIRGTPVIRARHVSVNGLWQAVQDTSSSEVRNYAGEILRLRSAPLTHRPGSQTIADVRVTASTVETVILGPTAIIREQVQPTVGAQIAFWARRGTLDGLPALVVSQIDLGTRVLDVREASVRSSAEDLLIPAD